MAPHPPLVSPPPPRPRAGGTPKPTKSHPILANPTNSTTDPAPPQSDLQADGSLSGRRRQDAEIEKRAAKTPEHGLRAEERICVSSGPKGVPNAVSRQEQQIEEQILQDLAKDIYSLLQPEAAVVAKEAPAVEAGLGSKGIINAQRSPMEEKRGKGGASRSSNKSSSTDFASPSGAKKGKSHSSTSKGSEAKIPYAEKEKWPAKHSSESATHTPWQRGSRVRSPSAQQESTDLEEGEIPGELSWHEGPWTEVKRPHWWRQERQSSTTSSAVRQHTQSFSGTAKFKQLAYGRCFNCLAPDHHTKDCSHPPTCWRCSGSGHQSRSCPRRPASGYIRQSEAERKHSHADHHHRQAERKHPQANHQQNTISNPYSTSLRTNTGSRSYLEAVRGTTTPAPMALAEYPGDPRARPAAESVFLSATGDIQRRREALIGKAAVCRLEGSTHDSRPSHVGEALRSRLGMDWIDFQVVKHFPEQYLVIFREEHLRQRVTRMRRLEDEGRVFHFEAWTEARGAANAHLEFRVNVRIEGIPPHAWGEDVAALILGRSCAIHYVEEHSRRRERTRTYDLWAWCADPCRISRRVWLTITDPDAEQPSINIPRNCVQVHHEQPTGLKHGLGYEIFPHLSVVEDLSFINGDGGQGGPPNRRRRRTFEWRYGQPDGLGEARPNREDRGRDELRRHRREDRDDDRGDRHRRRRSTSAWGRAVRCRSGVEDCYSSTTRGRAYNNRAGAAYRSRMMHWVPKLKEASIKIASATTNAAARRITKELAAAVKGISNLRLSGSTNKGKMVEANEKELMNSMPAANMSVFHLAQPLQKMEMEAINELLEQGTLMEKKGTKMARLPTRMATA